MRRCIGIGPNLYNHNTPPFQALDAWKEDNELLNSSLDPQSSAAVVFGLFLNVLVEAAMVPVVPEVIVEHPERLLVAAE